MSLRTEGITLIFTAVDCPSSNGLNERLNETLVNCIRCRVNEKNSKKAWTTIARQCVIEYNETIHSSTKFAPNYLMHGIPSNIVPFELRPITNLEEDRQKALENSNRAHNDNKIRVDKNRNKPEFKVGDLVYFENGNKLNRGKLDEVRIGPFPLIRRLCDTVFLVKCGPHPRDSRLYHVSKMLPYYNPVLQDSL